MANNFFRIKRRISGLPGAPSGLKNAELAHNEVDNTLYIGKGDDGSGNSTSVIPVGGVGAFVDLSSTQSITGTKTFTNSPIVPTQTLGDSTTKIATTQFVQNTVSGISDGVQDAHKVKIGPTSNGPALPTYRLLVPNDIPDLTSSKITDFEPETLATVATITGVANGLASLDSAGKVPTIQLPSYVDDIIEVANFASLPVTGETGKIYVTLNDNKQYRWSGATYVVISASPGSTDDVVEGSVNKYFTESRVLNTILTGLSTATASAITVTDTILQALGKLQAQINGKLTTANNLSDLPSASVARTNLGLGTISTQNANSVIITGGTLDNVTIDCGTF